MFTNGFAKNSCKSIFYVVYYTSLMCDEAGGCVHSDGNFRGVCPITGRQLILVTGGGAVHEVLSSERVARLLVSPRGGMLSL